MNTNLFLDLDCPLVSPFAAIREYSCSFVAKILLIYSLDDGSDKKITLATIAAVTFFAAYETVKTVVFPQMGPSLRTSFRPFSSASRPSSSRDTFFRQQLSLLEHEQTNRRLQNALVKSERDENLLRSIVASVAEGLVITDRESNVLIINDAARELLGAGQRPVIRLSDISRDPQFHKVFASALAVGERAVTHRNASDSAVRAGVGPDRKTAAS